MTNPTKVSQVMICLDIGGSYIRAVRLNESGKPTGELREKTPADDWGRFVNTLQEMGQPDPQVPFSISMAGVFDRRTGLAKVANIPCLHGRRVESELSDVLGRPVYVTNDADCFALAEAHLGAGRGLAAVFGVILGSGVGGGLVLDGQLHAGFGGIAGEWGHGPAIDPTLGGKRTDIPHFKCGCGQTGCVDATSSARGLERIHKALTGCDLKSRDITQAWRGGDAAATETLEIFAELTARALSMVINTLGPDIIPVGGGLANEPALIDMIDNTVRRYVLAEYSKPLVVPGTQGADGGLLGAAIAGRQRQNTHHR